jgi:hypothetical protein
MPQLGESLKSALVNGSLISKDIMSLNAKYMLYFSKLA